MPSHGTRSPSIGVDLTKVFQHLPTVPWEDESPGQTAYQEKREAGVRAPGETTSALPQEGFNALPGGWHGEVHMNGHPYYRNDNKNATTNIDLLRYQSDPLDYMPRDPETRVWSNWEVNIGEHGITWIDHEQMAISLPNQAPHDFVDSMKYKDTTAALHRQLQYWSYVQWYPNHIKLPTSAWKAAHDAIIWCYGDRVLFKKTNATFSLDDSKELLTILEKLREPSPVQTWFLAAVLRAITEDRLNSHYGKSDAHDIRIRESEDALANLEKHTPAMRLLYLIGGTLFLGIPPAYFQRIQAVDRTRFEDGGVNTIRWRNFLTSLLQEWRESNLLATVLISATVAFIAVPGLDDASRILALLSIVLSIGSVLVGVFFVWHHQPHLNTSGDIGLKYFTHSKTWTNSSVPLSIFLSTPVVFLVWSFVGFIAAILVFAFQGLQQTDNGMLVPFTGRVKPIVSVFFAAAILISLAALSFLRTAWSSTSFRTTLARGSKATADAYVQEPAPSPPHEDIQVLYQENEPETHSMHDASRMSIRSAGQLSRTIPHPPRSPTTIGSDSHSQIVRLPASYTQDYPLPKQPDVHPVSHPQRVFADSPGPSQNSPSHPTGPLQRPPPPPSPPPPPPLPHFSTQPYRYFGHPPASLEEQIHNSPIFIAVHAQGSRRVEATKPHWEREGQSPTVMIQIPRSPPPASPVLRPQSAHISSPTRTRSPAPQNLHTRTGSRGSFRHLPRPRSQSPKLQNFRTGSPVFMLDRRLASDPGQNDQARQSPSLVRMSRSMMERAPSPLSASVLAPIPRLPYVHAPAPRRMASHQTLAQALQSAVADDDRHDEHENNDDIKRLEDLV